MFNFFKKTNPDEVLREAFKFYSSNRESEHDLDTAFNKAEKYIKLIKKEYGHNYEDYIDASVYRIFGRYYSNVHNDNKKALEYYLKGADLEDIECQYNAGVFSTYIEDYENAYKYLIEAAKNGNIDAQLECGLRFGYGINGFSNDFKKSIKYCELAIKNEAYDNDAKPYVLMGRSYSYLEDSKKSFENSKYALDNCDFNDKNDLEQAYAWTCLGYADYLEDINKALECYNEGRERGLNVLPDEAYNELVECARKSKVYKTIDKIAANPIVQRIPYVGTVAKSYNLFNKIGELDIDSIISKGKDLWDDINS